MLEIHQRELSPLVDFFEKNTFTRTVSNELRIVRGEDTIIFSAISCTILYFLVYRCVFNLFLL